MPHRSLGRPQMPFCSDNEMPAKLGFPCSKVYDFTDPVTKKRLMPADKKFSTTVNYAEGVLWSTSRTGAIVDISDNLDLFSIIPRPNILRNHAMKV
jgi:hypothetical protein